MWSSAHTRTLINICTRNKPVTHGFLLVSTAAATAYVSSPTLCLKCLAGFDMGGVSRWVGGWEGVICSPSPQGNAGNTICLLFLFSLLDLSLHIKFLLTAWPSGGIQAPVLSPEVTLTRFYF